VAALEARLKEADHAIVLELLADRPHEDGTHLASRWRRINESSLKRTVNCTRFLPSVYRQHHRHQPGSLTYIPFSIRMMR
jgi:hypothetical protein